MNNKLPKVFVNSKQNLEANNQEMYYSKNPEKVIKKEERVENQLIVRKKINQIMSSPKFVYKLKVRITTNNGNFDSVIIAKEKDSLVTLDNKYIPISSIINIEQI